MRSRTTIDPSSLARLAQNPDAELRPVLLGVHVRDFADAPQRGQAAVVLLETMALGLIPLVSDDVLAETAAILRHVPETPRSVLQALEARLGPAAVSEPRALPLSALARAEASGLDPAEVAALVADDVAQIDLRLARNDALALDGHALRTLVSRAVSRSDLAHALLLRAEPTALDRALLYRHADRDERDRIRAGLATELSAFGEFRHSAPVAILEAIPEAAVRGDLTAVLGEASALSGIRIDAYRRPDDEPESELFVCGLLALGLDPDRCIATLLSLDSETSRSVSRVFRLATIVRSTPRAVAVFLTRRDAFQGGGRRDERGETVRPVSGRLRADGRLDPVLRPVVTPWRRASAPIARADRR